MSERIHVCGHKAKKGGWLRLPCPDCLPPDKAKKKAENAKRFVIEPVSPPAVEEQRMVSNWQPSDIITLNGSEYVSVATADVMVSMLTESLNDQTAKAVALAEEKQRIAGEMLRVKRVAKIATLSGSFLEITFDYRDTQIKPGQDVSFQLREVAP
jgi:hypothetical protein